MKLSPPPPHVARSGLRALLTICAKSPGGKLSDLQSEFLLGVQKHVLGTDYPLDQMSVISPAELAEEVKETEFRNRIIRACIVCACIDGEMNPDAVEMTEEFAQAFEVDRSPVRAAWKLANKQLLLARLAIVRKSLPGVKIKQTIKEEGYLAILKQFFPLLGIELPDVTARYKALEKYPEGTLGREFIEYVRRNNFPLPGQKGAGPEIIVLHDCLHILGGYGTSATEEIEVASFQAGCQFDNPIYGLLFGLAQYHLNIQVAPVAPSEALKAHPEKMLAAFVRGCGVNRDMWTDFRPWENFNKSVDALRTELNIAPK